jgi:hypothetical protein
LLAFHVQVQIVSHGVVVVLVVVLVVVVLVVVVGTQLAL